VFTRSLAASQRPRLVAEGVTHRGHVRATNEDYVLIGSEAWNAPRERGDCLDLDVSSRFLSPLRFYVVADGMGALNDGAAAAEEAANTAFLAFRQSARDFNFLVADELGAGRSYIGSFVDWDEGSQAHLSMSLLLQAQAALIRAVDAANTSVRTMAGGTTLLLAALADSCAFIAHVGDSRAYLIHSDDTWSLLTRDHNLAWEPVLQGLMSEEEAETRGLTVCLTQHLGSRRPIPDVFTVALTPGDRLVLCTDGVYRALYNDRKLAKISNNGSPAFAALRLRDAALIAGAPDNIGLVVVAPPVETAVELPAELRIAAVHRHRLTARARLWQIRERLQTGSLRLSNNVKVVGWAAALAIIVIGTWFVNGLPVRDWPWTTPAIPPTGPNGSQSSGLPHLSPRTTPRASIAAFETPVQPTTRECPVLPGADSYRTQPGDRLTQLASACGFSLDSLSRMNHIVDADWLPTDLVLLFPEL
jgi:serine/threonine protein phosphatase PrpC